jgi:predicted porin
MTSNAIDLGEHNGVNLDLTLQINRALMRVDNGTNSELFFVDNDNSSTRLNFTATTAINDDLTVGGEFEVEYQSNPSNQVDFSNRSISAEFNERRVDAWIENDRWGQLSLGHGSGAADGIMEVDLSGTSSINYSNPALLGGDISFGDDGPTISRTMTNLDFEGRYDRIRYDLPEVGAVKVAVSQGIKENTDIKELAVRIDLKSNGGMRFRSEFGYSVEEAIDTDEGEQTTSGGSIELRLPNGLVAGLAAAKSGDDDIDNPDTTYSALKLGYRLTKHAYSILAVRVKDRNQLKDISDSIGLGYVYSAGQGVNMYLGYKVHSLERPGEQYDDIKILTSGIRLKF